MSVLENLKSHNLKLPQPAPPAATYVPWIRSGQQIIISGQLPMRDGEILYKGRLGDTISEEEAIKAAELCGLNIIAQLGQALDGDFSKVVKCVRLGGFVHSTAEYEQHPAIINGASELMIKAFGEAGKHARAAVGVAALPFGVAVEIDAIFEIQD